MQLAVVSCSVLAALFLACVADTLLINQETSVAASNTSSRERASPVLHLRPNPGSSALPPPYMLHLYNRYRKGRLPHSTANTVRSFLPIPGKLGNRDILVFNLTGVHPTEYIERADLHLHGKRHVRANKQKARTKEGLRVKILDLSRPSMPEVERIPFSRGNSGWHTLDVTDGIITCLEGDTGEHHLVGLLAETESGTARLADITKMTSRPFLVVFSEDDDHMAIEELERRSLDLRRKTTSGSNATSVPKNRVKREIVDNELPDYLVQGGEESSRLEVQARMKHRPLDSDIIPYPDAPKTKPLRARHRKRRRRKERRLPLLWGRGWWKGASGGRHENDATMEEEDEEERRGQDDEGLCQRRKLVVDFAEIGWSEWIISPNSFEAHFCSGFCPFPLTKKVQPSNHATIQSLVHVLGLHNDVPSPCCVPQTMSSVTLLYFDEDRNVVLKNYPSMTVESCACR